MDVEKPPGTEDDPEIEGSAAEPGMEQDAAAAQVTAHSCPLLPTRTAVPAVLCIFQSSLGKDVCLSYAMALCRNYAVPILNAHPLSSGMWAWNPRLRTHTHLASCDVIFTSKGLARWTQCIVAPLD